ncbi:hypothetical protein DFH28DRAFT_915295 [Melampsora americana]|nr:hypothetical protein DFH28DRAFT_915295 [Melampsora americana]
MDSEEFQRKIDDQIRNKGEGGRKGKGVEGKEEGGNKGEHQDQGDDTLTADASENQVNTKNTKNPKTRAQPTRQSKRKNGQPPEPESQLVGPVRIKKPKGKAAIELTNIPQRVNKPPHNVPQPPHPPQIPTRNERQDRQIQHKVESEEESEEESVTGVAGGDRVLGGIFLDDQMHDDRQQTPPQMSAEDRMSQRLDVEIENAFAEGDRILYDQLTAEKRSWLEFKNKDQSACTTGVGEKSGKEVSVKKHVKVVIGRELKNDLVALSTYWATAMKDLSRYIPLSIFDPSWLRQDLNLTSTKSSRTKTKDAESIAYNGSPVPSEWRTTVAQWHRQKDLFLAYLEFYKHTEVIPSMKQHFENVLEIQKENDGSWVMAFRYDIEMRQSYLTFRIGDEEAMADIGVRNKKVERRAERSTIMRNDDFFLDNPYAHGQSKSFIDPIDGENWEGRSTTWDDPSRGEAKDEKNGVSKASQSIRSALWAQSRSKLHTAPQVTPSNYHSRPHTAPTTPATYTTGFQPPTQPANHRSRMNPNYRGNPQNYIHNYRSSFRGGRNNGGEGGSGGNHGGSAGGQRSWGRGKQGEEPSGQQNQSDSRGGTGKNYTQKK